MYDPISGIKGTSINGVYLFHVNCDTIVKVLENDEGKGVGLKILILGGRHL